MAHPFQVGDKVRLNPARSDWKELSHYGLYSDITYTVSEAKEGSVKVMVGGSQAGNGEWWWADRFIPAPPPPAKPASDVVVRAAKKLYDRGEYAESAALLLTLHD